MLVSPFTSCEALIMKKIIIVVLSSIFSCALASTNVPIMPVNLLIAPDLPQNANLFTPRNLNLDKSLLSVAEQDALPKTFLQHYYYPWSKNIVPTQFCITADGKNCSSVINDEKQIIATLIKTPGFNANYQPHSASWIKAIVANMALNTYPNINCNTSDNCHGITVTNTYIRAIPTNVPSYSAITEPGQAYPFDNLQNSELFLGTPVNIIQHSKDNHWLLIQTAGCLGWVEANTIAFASADFIKQWESYPLVTPILLKATIDHDLKMHEPKTIYLGSFFPFIEKSEFGYLIQLPLANAKQQAEMAAYHVSSDLVTTWPLIPTPRNFNRLINQFLGMPYGWGGLGLDSDCSGTLRRLFSAFAIWLPRDANDQLNFAGTINYLPLSKYSISQRKAILIHGARSPLPPLKPYLTLIGFGEKNNTIGHVVLYLGKYPQNNPKDLLLFQSVWGVAINQGNQKIGRAIIGKAAITTMGIGSQIDLGNTGYSISTLWQIPGIYFTDLTIN